MLPVCLQGLSELYISCIYTSYDNLADHEYPAYTEHVFLMTTRPLFHAGVDTIFGAFPEPFPWPLQPV